MKVKGVTKPEVEGFRCKIMKVEGVTKPEVEWACDQTLMG